MVKLEDGLSQVGGSGKGTLFPITCLFFVLRVYLPFLKELRLVVFEGVAVAKGC